MGSRSGQSYSQDLRERVIGAVDGRHCCPVGGGDLLNQHCRYLYFTALATLTPTRRSLYGSSAIEHRPATRSRRSSE
jgi:hypothetical protein